MTLCSPWIEAGDITRCSLDIDRDGDLEPSDLAMAETAVLVASQLLYAATAQLYPGICTDTIRPCSTAAGWAQAVDYPPNLGGSRLLADCGGTITSVVCDGRVWPAVDLPGRPVVDVTSVTIDGAAFTAYSIVDDRYLIRDDAGPWPTRNNLGLATTEPGTWGIVYRWGSAPPAYLTTAAEVLACEFIAAWCPGGDCPECHLPQRLQSITYEGATAAVLDPLDFLDSGGFGVPLIDYAVRAANPNHLQRNGRVVTVADVARTHYRVR